ncbi:MAG: heparan-alpha-glucosaminide N-acetyltransferase [Candidatus Methanoperedens sp.]|nr:heparan-alpha-glucosaminide N-acetyltransferase [Candidatus Methanoperedens sp.]
MVLSNLWSKKPRYILKHDRNQIIDLIRGVDIVLMVLFNYSVTLRYFRLINVSSDFLYWSVFPAFVASIFIFLSGTAARISFKKNKANFSRRYFLRGAELVIFAAFITLFTYIFTPEKTIFFGILHFFAVSSFLIPFFIKYNKLNLIAGLSITIFGLYLQQKEFNFSYLFWLGFMPENFSTFDYFPILPWLGVLLLGIYLGEYINDRTADMKIKNKLAGIFVFFGKNSLTIYLIHQPILIFLLIISGFKLF